ncbi:T9SS type A sorting domain-containing protein [candidate division TA06 bacterium]|uniref:T9SS type A sorting domain-containing protein n=1 Tax=candidate division TA06 bacterium TaxID=2250710 RepID=A0A523USK3_UNCT6|nr:MAG: T9SS type A sorting domain-containing protein [candidate division TA06 bacterium]
MRPQKQKLEDGMRGLIVYALAAALIAVFCTAERGDSAISWIRTFGGDSLDEGYCVRQTSDGGYIVVGTSARTESHDKGDVWLLRLDAFGNELWSQTYGDSGRDWGYWVEQTEDGGYIIAGMNETFGGTSADLWVIKADTLGEITWEKKHGGDSWEQGFCIQKTTDGGFITISRTYSYGAGEADIWLLKTDAGGDSMWARTYGDTAFEESRCVQQTRDGGYIMFGMTRSYSVWGDLDQWLVKTDSNGNVSWTETIGLDGYDAGYAVQETEDGSYILGGELEIVWGGTATLEKRDSLGGFIWSKEYGVLEFRAIYSVWVTDDGGVVATGIRGSSKNVFLLKVDTDGETQLVRVFDGMWGNSVQQTEDGGYVITGLISRGPVDKDLLVIKTDALGRVGVEEENEATILGHDAKPHLLIYPNPCSGTARIQYQLPTSAYVNMSVYDVSGRLVTTLMDEHMASGIYSEIWNAGNLPSGSYVCRVAVEGSVETEKVIVLSR